MSGRLFSLLSSSEIREPAPDQDVRVRSLAASVDEMTPEVAWDAYAALHDEIERWAQPVRAGLLGTQLPWTDEESVLGREIHRAYDELAALGYRIAQAFLRRGPAWDERVRQVTSRTLYLMGETVKWEVAVTPRAAHDYRKPHTLMREAIAAREHRRAVLLAGVPTSAGCTIESLYFRVMLLARFASGALNARQIEILDAWMWQWMPSLTSVASAPPGASLRVDLDAAEGLRRGRRSDDGPSLYLPQGPIEKAYRAVLAQFHAGHVVPASGLASIFRIEEYVAVLDLIQDGLRSSRLPVVNRAERSACEGDIEVELLVGIGEIAGRGLSPPADAGAATSDIYQSRRRVVKLRDESETGLGLEGSRAECAGVAAGDLVAIRRAPGTPLVLGRVARSMPSKGSRSIVMGVQRLGTGVQELVATREQGGMPGETVRMVLVVGADLGGRQDAFLVSDRGYAEAGVFSVTIEQTTYLFRYNRASERGRGWLLAGFEIMGTRSAGAPASP